LHDPTAAVCGLFFSHPQSKYSPSGKLTRPDIDMPAQENELKQKRKNGWTYLGY